MVSIVSSVVVSGTVVFAGVLGTGFTVVLGPAGCCVELFVLVFAAVDGVVKLWFLVGALEIMLWGGLVFEMFDFSEVVMKPLVVIGERGLVLSWLAIAAFFIVGIDVGDTLGGG